MKFSVMQENLIKGLQIVNRIATTRATLPVLGNIMLVTDQGRLKLVTTDLELAIDTYVGAKVEIEGAITIPARTLTEFVVNNNDTTIDFSLKDTVLTATSQHYTATMMGIDAQEFPTVPPIDQSNPIVLNATLLKEAINQTVFATTQDETRPVLNGVAFFLSPKELKLVATDSYRLAERKLSQPTGFKEDATVIVPSRTLLELNRLITDEVAEIKLFIDKHQVLFIVGESHLVSRIIEGNFPAYESLIPKSLATTATLNRQEFVASLKMASLFSRDSAYNVTFSVDEKELTLKALSAQIGTSTSKVSAAVSGPATTIAFNARFILDVLQVITSDAIQFKLQSPEDNHWFPGVIQSTQDEGYQYVIMPLRTEA